MTELNCLLLMKQCETSHLDNVGNVLKIDRKPNMKRIRLKSLNERSNIEALAKEVVEKCKLISQNKLPLVVKLLYQLRQRDFMSHVDIQDDDEMIQQRTIPKP